MKISVMISALVLALLLASCAAAFAETELDSITYGTQTQRGFVNDNIYHSELGIFITAAISRIPTMAASHTRCLSRCPAGKDCTFKALGLTWWRTSARRQ